jgi:alkylated DNA repair dioxygenase AlkB
MKPFNPLVNKLLDFLDESDDEPDKQTKIIPTIKLIGSLYSQMNVLLITNFLDINMADTLFEKLKHIKYNSDEQSMVKIMGKEFKIPRKQTAYGEPNTTYHFSGTSVQANDWSEGNLSTREDFDKYNSDIRGMLKWVAKKAGKIACATFNYALINNYIDQTNCIGYHSDDEKELGKYPVIAGLSLGQEREIYFKSNITDEVKKISLPHNSFFVMFYPTNKFWKHSIPKTTRRLGQRISLTFRSVA